MGVWSALSTMSSAGSSRSERSPAPRSEPVFPTSTANGTFAAVSADHAGSATHCCEPTGLNTLKEPLGRISSTAITAAGWSFSSGPSIGTGLNASSSASRRTAWILALPAALALPIKPPSIKSLPSAKSMRHISTSASRRSRVLCSVAYFLPFSVSSTTRPRPS